MSAPSVDERRTDTLARRGRTIPLVLLAFALASLALPLLLALGALVDLARFAARRTPWISVRLICFLWLFLAAEVAGVIALAALWPASGFGLRSGWLDERTWRFQQAWTGGLFAAARRVFALELELEGAELLARGGPMIVLIRHASIFDNLLPAVLVARPHGIHLRYVLKRELLSDPCLDIAGKRLANHFVQRESGDRRELEALRELAGGLGPAGGVLLYPEGTRFTAERRARAIVRLAERDPRLAERARAIEHLLAPRSGGFLALLEGAPDADVVLIAHEGFDGLRLLSDVWRRPRLIVGRTINVRVTRTERARIPADHDGRIAWLYDEWASADRWIGARLAQAPR